MQFDCNNIYISRTSFGKRTLGENMKKKKSTLLASEMQKFNCKMAGSSNFSLYFRQQRIVSSWINAINCSFCHLLRNYEYYVEFK